jgi:hypothetical protein
MVNEIGTNSLFGVIEAPTSGMHETRPGLAVAGA